MKGSIGWFLLIGLLLLAACSGPAQPAPVENIAESASAQPLATGVSPVPAETELADATDPQESSTSDAATEAAQPVEPTEAPTELPPPTPRIELQATNPGDARLASGGLQFVEFFAYW